MVDAQFMLAEALPPSSPDASTPGSPVQTRSKSGCGTEDSSSDDEPAIPEASATISETAVTEPGSELTKLLSSLADWRLESPPSTPAAPEVSPVGSRLLEPNAPGVSESQSCPPEPDPPFTHTIVTVKHQQVILRKRVDSVEMELTLVRNKVTESIRTSTNLLLKTQQIIVNERRTMEKQHERSADSIQALENKLNKAQRHIATLQAQHVADKGLIEQLAQEIAVLWDQQEDIGGRLQRAEECEEQVRVLAERLREFMEEVKAQDINARKGRSEMPSSLDEELSSGTTLASAAEEAPITEVSVAEEDAIVEEVPVAEEVPVVSEVPVAEEVPIVGEVPTVEIPAAENSQLVRYGTKMPEGKRSFVQHTKPFLTTKLDAVLEVFRHVVVLLKRSSARITYTSFGLYVPMLLVAIGSFWYQRRSGWASSDVPARSDAPIWEALGA